MELVTDEDTLTDWIGTEIDTGGFSGSVTIEEWYNGNPKSLTVHLEYKTGDGCDQPYGDYPPDDVIIKDLEKHAWNVDAHGSMYYPDLAVCEKCGRIDDKFTYDDESGEPSCKKCGATEVWHESGNKWISGHKTINLKGNETEEQIKDLIQKAIYEVV